ncbi:helix-turn-helix transcriptional regulator [Flavobacterium sp.]|uniref:helix-turn-helix transcriptional regulator n=1 Tax=Flavobacterium sp. TaxID=239 RepID=UPI0037509FA8
MSVNKKAQIRYLTLDKCLRNFGRLYTWQNLLDEVNSVLADEIHPKTQQPMRIGKTQLFEDLKDLEYRVYNAPISKKAVGKAKYYSYDDPSYSIQNAPLNETEISQIKASLQLLSRFQGLPDFGFIDEVIPTIQKKLGIINLEKEIMSFDNNLDYEGSKHITPLFNAIVNKRVLTILYQDFKNPDPYEIIFHPFYLKQYNSRWFVFGYNEFMQNQFWNMALDRIKSVAESKFIYIESETDWEDYFYDIVGVTKAADRKLELISLWFAPSQAPYIITKPIHPTQTIVKNNIDGLEIKIKVIPNYELEKLILSFANSVKVLSPKTLQDVIFEKLQKAIELY